jgi:ParB family chromosome partitioning protein
MIKMIDIKLIDPSPFQIRKYFDPDALKEFAASILREGQIAPIMVRRIGERYEIIVGEIRYRAVRDYTNMKTIQAEIIEATDREARRKSFAENILWEDLSVVEQIEGNVRLVDDDLMEYSELIRIRNMQQWVKNRQFE